ncbi:MAG: cell division protein FtsB [Ectothiorhodospiraceae bacterium]|nr:cell division protein FtsB [Ectothiorhodospiraceae bacterium]
MKAIIVALAILFVLLQCKLWFGEGSMKAVWLLDEAIVTQVEENALLKERNETLSAEVDDLKQGYDAIEERARHELGMIKEGETFYQVVD